MFDWSGVYFKKVVMAEKAWVGAGYTAFMATMATGRFIADSMLLLKRPLSGGKYQVLKRFEFQNLPVATKQASLFGPLSPGGGT